LPSESESFGLAALEAMACEVPVISSNAGGIPEVNIHGVTGYVCEVGDVDAMSTYCIELLSDENKLKQFRENAYSQAKKFDIVKLLPEYIQYYEDVIRSSNVYA
jgi:glycosyltransferase involved in cell wall biosynthesis